MSVAIGRTDNNVATGVPLHNLVSHIPSAPNQMDKRTNTGPSQNIIHANIASRDKNLVYLCVGHPRSLKMVPLDRTRNFLFFVPAEVYAYLELFPRYGMSKKFCGWNA